MHSSKDDVAPPRDSWIQDTQLFRRSLERREEISEHKWYESERAGCDVGWERASVSYLFHRFRGR